MAAEQAMTPSSYIGHHLSFLQHPVGEGSFWTLNVDSLATAGLLGVLGLGFLWWVVRGATSGVPSKRQAFVEILCEFVDNQAKDIFHGDRKFIAPVALTVGLWWLLMNYFSIAVKGLGGWIHELFCTPFGVKPLWASPLLAFFNLLFNLVEYISKPLSHSLRLFGNMYAGEIIFLLLWMMAGAGLAGTFFAVPLGLIWAIFHVLIVALQAYIFIMLTVVYIVMAHESH